MKRKTTIKLVDFKARWALVQVCKPDQTIVREYRIKAEEAEAVHANNELPPGLTEEERSSMSIITTSKPLLPGDALINEDGSLTFNYGILELQNRIQSKVAHASSDEWELIDGVVYLEAWLADMAGL